MQSLRSTHEFVQGCQFISPAFFYVLRCFVQPFAWLYLLEFPSLLKYCVFRNFLFYSDTLISGLPVFETKSVRYMFD